MGPGGITCTRRRRRRRLGNQFLVCACVRVRLGCVRWCNVELNWQVGNYSLYLTNKNNIWKGSFVGVDGCFLCAKLHFPSFRFVRSSLRQAAITPYHLSASQKKSSPAVRFCLGAVRRTSNLWLFYKQVECDSEGGNPTPSVALIGTYTCSEKWDCRWVIITA